jgi:hypothetical protein
LEIIMTTSKLTKTSNRPLMLLSAALLLQTGSAMVTAHAGDAQTQARELLSQTTGDRSATADIKLRADETPRAALNPQEQARRVLLGPPSAAGEAGVAAARYAKSTSTGGVTERNQRHSYSDAQEMARRVIMGTAI